MLGTSFTAKLFKPISPVLLGNKLAKYSHNSTAGSVNGGNANELAHQPDVDGFLVGGASLKVSKLRLLSRSSGFH